MKAPLIPIAAATALAVVLLSIVPATGWCQENSDRTHDSSVVVYPGPPEVLASRQYSVQITLHSRSYDSFVYQVQNPGFSNGQLNGQPTSSTKEQSTAWTSFSAGVSVIVSITNAEPFTSARVLPSHEGIPVSVQGATVSFPITHPGQYAVDFCSSGSTCSESAVDLRNPLLIFANPPETDVPDPNAPNVTYFGPGIHDLGSIPYVIQAGQLVYLAGGAYVRGFFRVADGAANWAIRGRGILSGEGLQKSECVPDCPPMISGPRETTGYIEGVTLIQSPLYNIALGGYNATFDNGLDNTGTRNIVDNVKVIAWHGNTDGIATAYGSEDPGSVLRNSFFKVGDSAIHLNSSHLRVSHCTIWQLENAAPFEISDTLGSNLDIDVHDVRVEHSDVIRTEHEFESMETAVFSAHQGGKGTLSQYLFDDLRVENSGFRLFSLAVRPSPWSRKNVDLAGLDDLLFRNISVSDAQTQPNLLQSYDRQHRLTNLRFENVVVAGQTLPERPVTTFSANRTVSLGGNVTYDPLWRNTNDPTEFETQIIDPATAPAVSYASVSLREPDLTQEFHEQAVGDFYGDGFASVLFSRDGTLGIWRNPIRAGDLPVAERYLPIGYALGPNDQIAGVGDFNDDGKSDILIWNFVAQTGTLLLMNGEQIVAVMSVHPGKTSDWNVAGIGDFDQNGYSDILLRDSHGDLEILGFGIGSAPVSSDFEPSELFAHSTDFYDQQWSPVSGTFDSAWTVAGVGDSRGLGYAEIVWYQPTTGDLGMTAFSPGFQTERTGRVQLGQVFVRIPLAPSRQVIVPGNFDANGTSDILLQNSATGLSSILYTNLWLSDSFSLGTGKIAVAPNRVLLR